MDAFYTHQVGSWIVAAREDYSKALQEFSITEKEVRAISEYTVDMRDLPEGEHKIRLGHSLIEGTGLFATQEIAANELIAFARINNQRTIAGRYTNHSNNPNAHFELQPDGDLKLVASGQISAGEEIVIDYRYGMSMALAGRKTGQSLAMREKVYRLEEELSKLPQADCPVRHYFAPGLYAREITIPKGVALTGAIHKTENLVVLSAGKLRLVTENGTVDISAPHTMTCKAGAKNAAYALEDSVWTNFFPTDETDTDKLIELLTESKASELLGGADNKQLAANRAAKVLEG